MKTVFLFLVFLFLCPSVLHAEEKRPNILFVIFDDLSAMHTGPYGDKCVKTPAMDRVAREGVTFSRAFCAVPSCTPSRSAILTGQAIWRLEEAGLLMGTFPPKFKVYPWMLDEAGYFIGYTGKGWAPGNFGAYGRKLDPVGRAYQQHKSQRAKPDWSDPSKKLMFSDYAANFKQFLSEKPKGKPFYFHCGFIEPHLDWPRGAGAAAGLRPQDVRLPGGMPDHPLVRNDLLDYYFEIQFADEHLAQMLKMLEEAGELDNTMVIVTSDHGNPLPRSKCNLYDSGTQVPFVVRYPKLVKPGRVVDDIISLTDVAPTLLEAAGLKPLPEMTGRSLMELISSEKSGVIDPSRDAAYIAFERHTWTRADGKGYPVRALRTDGFLYIHNYLPERWPAGDPDLDAEPQGFYGDIDRSQTKAFLLANRDDPKIAPYFQRAVGRRPAEELYDVKKDPDQLKNLASDPAMADVKKKLRERMDKYLADTGDPRSRGEALWDGYPYYYKDWWKRAKHLKTPVN